MKAKPWLGLVIAMVLALPAAALADTRSVLQVIGVKVQGDFNTYIEKVKKLRDVSRRLGMPTFRIWRATLAGSDAGTIFVAVEHPSMAALAESTARLSADPEWQKVIKDLDKSGIRTVISNSLLEEVTP